MIIECESLVKRFRGHDAVRDVSLRVEKGSALAVIGANGAGKTTTLRMLVNILTPDSGTARILGIDSRRLRSQDFCRIGYVSENQKISDRMTVGQYCDYLRRLYPNWDRAHEANLRRQLDLPADRPLGKLSHGMRMKAMLVGALAFRPEVLLMDEPLSGLDPLVRDEVMEGLLGQAGETTIVISSHELAEIEGCATDVVFMDRGRVVFQDTMDDLMARFRHVTVTLARDSAVGPSATLPYAWLSPKANGQVFTFVDRAYTNDDALRHQINEHVGPVQLVRVDAISLRDLSKELMRASRTGGVQ